MYKIRRRLYSQNFLRQPELVAKLVGKSSIGKSDTVVEIGPGRGIITCRLILSAGYVIAVELDYDLYCQLKAKFRFVSNLDLVNADILNFDLPKTPYKVFANIPFRISADIVRRLTTNKYFQEGFLVVQKEAAQKLIGLRYDNRNQMMSTLLKPWFDISVLWEFDRSNFTPRPNVDTVMLKITRRVNPIISNTNAQSFRDFIVYSYNRKKIARLSFSAILQLFQKYDSSVIVAEKKLVTTQAGNILRSQINLHKIHRSRTAKNWRKL